MPPSSAPLLDDDRRQLLLRVLIATGITVAITFVLWLFFHVLLVAAVWPAPESPPQQGEAVLAASIDAGQPVHDPMALARAVREPVNTWSCLAFVFVAALMVQLGRDALARWFAVVVALAGIGAMFYHASASRLFRSADLAGLYWGAAVFAMLGATRLGWLDARVGRGSNAFLVFVATGVLAWAATVFRNVAIGGFKPLALPVVGSVAAVVSTLVLAILVLKERASWQRNYALAAIGLMVIGFLLQLGDHPGGALTLPGAWLQPHAIWHVFCAASVGLAFLCLEGPRRALA